jgi:peptidase E
VSRTPESIRIAFVPTAATNSEEMKYVAESRDELINLGIKGENIREICLNGVVDYSEIGDCDAMYVCGGNTFHLLDKIRKSHFELLLKKFLVVGRVYLGVSAGSIVVTPSIAIAKVEPADQNEVGLTNLSGLSVVDFEISPHVPEIVSYDSVEDYSKTTKNKIYAIDHGCAVLVQDSDVSVVGGGSSKVYN